MKVESLSKYVDIDNLNNQIDIFQSDINKYQCVPSKLLFDNCQDTEFALSVVIPTYKRSEYLINALESLKAQTTKLPFCILIFDNSGICDNNSQYNISQINRLGLKNVKYFLNKSNIGMAGNWNRSINMANTEFVAMLHDDDLVHKNFVESVCKIISYTRKKHKKVGIIQTAYKCFSQNEEIDFKKNTNRKTFFYEVSLNNFVFGGLQVSNPPTCGIVFNKAAFIECGGFLEDFYPSMDFLISVQMFRKKYKIYRTRDVLGYYRIAINESLKKDNVIGFCIMGTFLRTYAASLTPFLKFSWGIIGKQWYKYLVKTHYNFAKNHRLDCELNELDVLSLCNGKEPKLTFYRLFLKAYRKVFYLLKLKEAK